MGNLLAFTLVPGPTQPTPPPRHADLAHYAVFDLAVIDRGACVTKRVSLDADLFIELRSGFWCIQRHFELRPFVFFDLEVSDAPRAATHLETDLPNQTVPG